MSEENKSTEQNKDLDKHRKSILRHKDEVLKNCVLLGERIIEMGGLDNTNFGRELIVRGYSHDNSKLHGIEWEYLMKGEELLELAHKQHILTNDHHPEYWLMRGMDLLDVPSVVWAEAVCDWKARSSEFGSDLRSWIKDVALEKWNIPLSGKVYKKIKFYVDLLLDEPFK